jgi:hypothetical protein
MGNNVTPAAGNYVLTSASQLGNYVIADTEYLLTCTYTILRRMKTEFCPPVSVHIESPRSAH